jgi:hypothetical protein
MAICRSTFRSVTESRLITMTLRGGWRTLILLIVVSAYSSTRTAAEDLVPRTTLDNPAIAYRKADQHSVVLKRADVEVIVVDNEAVRDDRLPDHRAGYSGIASLKHSRSSKNYFVPTYSGLNYEHILDGRAESDRKIQFEPRNWPMELRIINDYAVELYQSPTFHHGLESCQRYELLEDGTIQLTIEVIPRRRSFPAGYICLFWASYINQPESLDIHFRGIAADQAAANDAKSQWIRGITPQHGVRATHPSVNDHRSFAHDEPYPLTLVFQLSDHRYTEPWYFGVNDGLAFVQMFRPQDQVRLTQSPSGGGAGNPAWDFQYLIDDYEVDRRYQFVMRASCLRFESAEQIAKATEHHRLELASDVP